MGTRHTPPPHGGEASGGIAAMALAGGILAVLCLMLGRVFPDLPWTVVFPALLGAGLGWTRGLLDGSAARGAFGLVLGAAAGLVVSSGMPAGNALLACGLFGGLLGAYHALDERQPRLLVSAVLTTGLLASVGAAGASILVSIPALPELIGVGAAGSIFGMAIGSGDALRLRHRDLVLRRCQQLREGARGELEQLLEALMREYDKLERFIGASSHLGPAERRRLRQRVTELTEHVLRTAERGPLLERELARLRPSDLQHRAGEVRRRIEASSDDVVREHYAQALQALQEQGEHYRGLEEARERLVSRLTSFLTSMQGLYLAMVSLETTGQDQAPEAQRLAERLGAVGDEVETLRLLADEMSLRRRLEGLPGAVRSLRPEQRAGPAES
jgi:hypothetical protein